jgi:hydroxymethylpyrimidine/phosphomethylpyrimidine kinase
MPRRPIALTIAGSDSSGGAGIQADLKTFSALGLYGASVITAVTAQNTRGVQGVETMPAAFVALQLRSVLDDLDVSAIKTGMLATREIVLAVAAALGPIAERVPVIVDPVMVATSGDALLQPDAVDAYRTALFPLAALITPNLAEAARLTGRTVATSLDQMDQGSALIADGARAVLVKGGHATGDEAVDVFVMQGYVKTFAAPRIDTRHTHGTGCTLSAAIAAGLALGQPLPIAIERAKDYLTAALRAGDTLRIGAGSGPVDHFHAITRI